MGPFKRSTRTWWTSLDPDARVFAGSYLLLLPFFLAPLFVTRLLPGLDLPFHLSMVDMLSKAGSADSPYRRFYQGTPMLAPYALHYLLLWLLTAGKVLALTTAHKVIVAAYVAGLPLAAASLLAVCGRSRIPALLAFPLAYNLTLHYGFISSALSLPVVLLVLAEIARLLTSEGDRAGLVRRWLAAAFVAWLLFLSHLQNFLYGVCAALAFVVFCRVSLRRRLLAAASLLPALASCAWWQRHATSDLAPPTTQSGLSFAWNALKGSRVGDLGHRPVYADLAERLEHLASHALRGFNDGVDTRAARTLLILVLLYFCLGLGGRALRSDEGEPRPVRLAAACWVAFGGALFAYLALPHHLQQYELMTFFPRFAPLAMAMMLPLVPSGLRRFSGELRGLLPLPAVLFGVLYGRQVVEHYRLFGKETEDFLYLLDRAEPGHRALGLVFDRQSRVMKIESIFLGLPTYYATDHAAPGSMTPLWYCGMRHIPCRHTKEFADLPDPGPWEPYKLDYRRAVPFFDYFFVRSPPPGPLFGTYQGSMEMLAKKGTWSLWRRRPGAVPSPLDRPYDD